MGAINEPAYFTSAYRYFTPLLIVIFGDGTSPLIVMVGAINEPAYFTSAYRYFTSLLIVIFGDGTSLLIVIF